MNKYSELGNPDQEKYPPSLDGVNDKAEQDAMEMVQDYKDEAISAGHDPEELESWWKAIDSNKEWIKENE